jgi:transcriptional antiterminator NusG
MSHKWYIIHTLSGSERKVKQAIIEQAQKGNMIDYFKEIIIPAVEVAEVRKGKKILSEKKIMPGYMLINMEMTDDAWHLVRNIPKVSGFLGNASKPRPVSQAEVEDVLKHMEVEMGTVSDTMYEVGQIVKVVEGPFESFSGVVETVDVEKSRMCVSVTIFGRETPLDLEFSQVEKI